MIESSHMAESTSFQHQEFTEPKENLRYLPPSGKEDRVSPKTPMQGYDMNNGHFRGRSESSSQPSKKSRSGPKGRSISPSKRFKAKRGSTSLTQGLQVVQPRCQVTGDCVKGLKSQEHIF